MTGVPPLAGAELFEAGIYVEPVSNILRYLHYISIAVVMVAITDIPSIIGQVSRSFDRRRLTRSDSNR